MALPQEAASSGCDKAVSCLIAHGARLTALDSTHWPSMSHTDQTPLCLAARAGHLSTVALLFAHCNAEREYSTLLSILTPHHTTIRHDTHTHRGKMIDFVFGVR